MLLTVLVFICTGENFTHASANDFSFSFPLNAPCRMPGSNRFASSMTQFSDAFYVYLILQSYPLPKADIRTFMTSRYIKLNSYHCLSFEHTGRVVDEVVVFRCIRYDRVKIILVSAHPLSHLLAHVRQAYVQCKSPLLYL